MKKLISLLTLIVLSACNGSKDREATVGGDRDSHNCIASAGQSWSVLKNACVQPFEVADIKLEESRDGASYGVYVILSADKRQAEIFALDVPDNTLLAQSNDGYASSDGKLRLIRAGNGWQLQRQ